MIFSEKNIYKKLVCYTGTLTKGRTMRVMRFGNFISLGLFRTAESKEFDLLGGEDSDSDLLKIKSESDFWNVEESDFWKFDESELDFKF